MADQQLVLAIKALDEASSEIRRVASAFDPNLVRSAAAAGAAGASAMGKIDSSARSTASGIEHLATRFTTLTTAILTANAIQNTMSRGFDLITGAVFGMNATLETATLQFTTLMGSADLAREHVKAMFEEGKESPFATEPILQASRFLEVFGGAALNTRENIKKFGDAAAATNTQIEEVSFWVGRMYAALQAGRPFGESIQRFQELGILTPQVAAALSDISEKGGDGAKAWELLTTDLDRFNGAQKAMAGTWQGLTSTFSDTLNQLIAGAAKPFFELMETGLANLNTLLGSDEAAQFSADLAARFTEVLGNLGTMKDSWIAQFKTMTEGEGLGAVDAALKATANLIGTEISPQTKKDFETITGAVGGLADALGRVNREVLNLQTNATELKAKLDTLPNAITGLKQSMQGVVDLDRQLSAAAARTLQAGGANVDAAQAEAARLTRNAHMLAVTSDAAVAALLASEENRARAEATLARELPGVTTPGEEPPPGATEPPAATTGRDTRMPPFAVATRGGAAGGGAGSRAAGSAAAEEAIAGFMDALTSSQATLEDAFGKTGGKVASALSEAIAKNTGAAGRGVATAMESLITTLREAGVEDWRATGDLLAGALHDALVARTPEAVAAAMQLIGMVAQQAREAEFWAAWQKQGAEAAAKVTAAMKTLAEKTDEAWQAFRTARAAAIQDLADTRALDAARAQVDDVLEGIRRAQDEGGRLISRQRSDRDTATARLRQDADAAAAHEQRLAEIRKRGGATVGVDTRAENERFAREQNASTLQRSREDADRRQRIADEAIDIVRRIGNEQNIADARRGIEKALGVDRETLQNQALTKQLAGIEETRKKSIEAAEAAAAIVKDTVAAALDAAWTEYTKKFGINPETLPTNAGEILSQANGTSGGTTGGAVARQTNVTNYGIVVDMPTFAGMTLDAEQRTEQTAAATQGP